MTRNPTEIRKWIMKKHKISLYTEEKKARERKRERDNIRGQKKYQNLERNRIYTKET